MDDIENSEVNEEVNEEINKNDVEKIKVLIETQKQELEEIAEVVRDLASSLQQRPFWAGIHRKLLMQN